MSKIPPYFMPGTGGELDAVLDKIENENAEYQSALTALATLALRDFDYATADAAGRAQDELGEAITTAIDAWIEANCTF